MGNVKLVRLDTSSVDASPPSSSLLCPPWSSLVPCRFLEITQECCLAVTLDGRLKGSWVAAEGWFGDAKLRSRRRPSPSPCGVGSTPIRGQRSNCVICQIGWEGRRIVSAQWQIDKDTKNEELYGVLVSLLFTPQRCIPARQQWITAAVPISVACCLIEPPLFCYHFFL